MVAMARPNHLSILIWYGGNFWLINWNNKLQRTLTQEFMHMFCWFYLNFNLNQILLRRNSFKRAMLSQKISIFLWSQARRGRWKMFSHVTIDKITLLIFLYFVSAFQSRWSWIYRRIIIDSFVTMLLIQVKNYYYYVDTKNLILYQI